VKLEESTPRAALWFLDNLVLVHLRGDETNGRWDLIEFWAAPGDQPPPHVHNLHDESFYVTAGEVTLYLPDRKVVMSPGQFFLAPRGVPHTFCVTSDDEARWLVTSAPAGVASFRAGVWASGRGAQAARPRTTGCRSADSRLRQAWNRGLGAPGSPSRSAAA
jgi:quercetin dioxygenase-like cupin family protein